MPTSKIWDGEELQRLWPQAAGELRGYKSHLDTTNASITASQLGMALQLADIGFKTFSGETVKPVFPVEAIDRAEAILNTLITLTLRGNLGGINIYQGPIMETWTALKDAREKAGRPTPKIR